MVESISDPYGDLMLIPFPLAFWFFTASGSFLAYSGFQVVWTSLVC